MKRFAKLLAVCLAAALIVSAAVMPASAINASVTIKPSTATPENGKQFTVSVTFAAKGMMGIGCRLTYNPDVLTLVPDNNEVTAPGPGLAYLVYFSNNEVSSKTFTVRFKTKAVGDSTIAVDYDGERSGVVGSDESQAQPRTSTTVSIIDPALSNNANLKALSVSSGTLTPGFSPNTTIYRVTVPFNVTTFTVSAVPDDKGAAVSLSGGEDLKVGENVRTVTVKAPSGVRKTYTIHITRLAEGEVMPEDGENPNGETPKDDPLWATWHGADYFVADKLDNVEMPAGFTVGMASYNGIDVPAAVSADGSVTLLYLLNDTRDAGNFFIYDAELSTFAEFLYVVSAKLTYVFLDPPKSFSAPAGYKKVRRVIGEQEVDAWALPGDDTFCLVYVVSSDGNRGLYRYDDAEKTLQRYIESEADKGENSGAGIPGGKLLLVGGGMVILLLAAAVAVLFRVAYIQKQKLNAVHTAVNNPALDNLSDIAEIDGEFGFMEEVPLAEDGDAANAEDTDGRPDPGGGGTAE